MPRIVEYRKDQPERRPNVEEKGDYKDYHDLLREDFNCRCGYCDSFDIRRNNDFELDHFIPQRLLNTISKNNYYNLVYSCKSCNRAKSGKWATDNELESLDGEKGFIDPCADNYHLHFVRHDDGDINWNSNTGKWMYRELALFNIQHSIAWILEKLRNAIEDGKKILNEKPDNPTVKEGLLALYIIEDKFLNKLFNAK